MPRRCKRVGDRSDRRSRDQPVRPARRPGARRARAERQHDRRGAGLELVHQSPPDETGDAGRGVARPAHRQRAGTGAVERGVAEAGRLRARVHDARLRAASSGSSRSTRRAIPKPRPARSWSPTRSSGRSATGRWRTTWSPSRRTRSLISEKATFTPPSGRERRMERRDLDDVFARAHRSADGTLSRRRRPRRARPSDRRVPLPRHPARRSQRRRPARAPARAASPEGVRRVDQPGRT